MEQNIVSTGDTIKITYGHSTHYVPVNVFNNENRVILLDDLKKINENIVFLSFQTPGQDIRCARSLKVDKDCRRIEPNMFDIDIETVNGFHAEHSGRKGPWPSSFDG